MPTWDYAAVHVHGTLVPVTDDPTMEHALQGLSAGDPGQFTVSNMPERYRAQMMAGIRAFTLVPTKVEAQWKMSQNRSITDRQRVAAALRAQPDPASAQVAAVIESTIGG